jgi:hypothetical protein
MEAVRTSEKSVYFNQTTRRYTPEGCHVVVEQVLEGNRRDIEIPLSYVLQKQKFCTDKKQEAVFHITAVSPRHD